MSSDTGYMQHSMRQALLPLARQHDLVVGLRCARAAAPEPGVALAVLSPAERADDARTPQMRKTVLIGQARTPDPDVEFPVLLLEEMSVRAPSPDTNDPDTPLTRWTI